jgi:hypothetical protein
MGLAAEFAAWWAFKSGGLTARFGSIQPGTSLGAAIGPPGQRDEADERKAKQAAHGGAQDAIREMPGLEKWEQYRSHDSRKYGRHDQRPLCCAFHDMISMSSVRVRKPA